MMPVLLEGSGNSYPQIGQTAASCSISIAHPGQFFNFIVGGTDPELLDISWIQTSLGTHCGDSLSRGMDVGSMWDESRCCLMLQTVSWDGCGMDLVVG